MVLSHGIALYRGFKTQVDFFILTGRVYFHTDNAECGPLVTDKSIKKILSVPSP